MTVFKKINSLILLFIFIFVFVAGFKTLSVQAQTLFDDIGLDYAGELDLPDPGSENNIQEMAIIIIKYLMTFLGIIAVVIILYGGFVWMTAGGNDDRVGKAKRILVAGIIGLVIIISSYAIVTFVVSMTEQAMQGDLG